MHTRTKYRHDRVITCIREREQYTTNPLLSLHVYWTLLSDEQVWEQRGNSLDGGEINLHPTFCLQAKQITIPGKICVWHKYLILFKMIDRINILNR